MIPYDQYHTPTTMSHRMSSSLDDTIPLDKGTSKLELSDSNRTYYGSDISLPSEKKSRNSLIEILYEVINLTHSNSGNHGKKDVTLRYKHKVQGNYIKH